MKTEELKQIALPAGNQEYQNSAGFSRVPENAHQGNGRGSFKR